MGCWRGRAVDAVLFFVHTGFLRSSGSGGVATLLFEAQCERAASSGHKVAGLIVDVDKAKAEALYARLGFRYIDDKDFFVHTMKHMVRIL